MKTMKIVTIFILVLAVAATGVPLRPTCDIDGNDAVDLADAVLQIQRFSRSVDDPVSFREAASDAITTLNVVAGVKRIFKKSIDSGPGTSTPPSNERPCLLSSHPMPDISGWCRTVTHTALSYRSISLPPETPPPVG